MKEIIMVDEKTRIYHADSLNWTVQVLRTVEHKDETKSEEWTNANGKYGPFAGKPDSPVLIGWILENAQELDGFDGTLAEYTKAVDKAGKCIAKSIAESNGEVG